MSYSFQTVLLAGLLVLGCAGEEVASENDSSTVHVEESTEAANESPVAASVPDVVGLPIAEAREILEAVGFVALLSPTNDSEGEAGVVILTAPNAGTSAEAGTIVEIAYRDRIDATGGETLAGDEASSSQTPDEIDETDESLSESEAGSQSESGGPEISTPDERFIGALRELAGGSAATGLRRFDDATLLGFGAAICTWNERRGRDADFDVYFITYVSLLQALSPGQDEVSELLISTTLDETPLELRDTIVKLVEPFDVTDDDERSQAMGVGAGVYLTANEYLC